MTNKNLQSMSFDASVMPVMGVPCVIFSVPPEVIHSPVWDAGIREELTNFVAANGGGTLILASREASGKSLFSGPQKIVNHLLKMGWQGLGLTPHLITNGKQMIFRTQQHLERTNLVGSGLR